VLLLLSWLVVGGHGSSSSSCRSLFEAQQKADSSMLAGLAVMHVLCWCADKAVQSTTGVLMLWVHKLLSCQEQSVQNVTLTSL
jgi:hypothetical protein